MARAGLGGQVSFAWPTCGAARSWRRASRCCAQPPASTAKAMTALYALDGLGGGHRFATRVLATGPVEDGRLEGDLVLAGGGDPVLDTDGLALWWPSLPVRGCARWAGGSLVWPGALPRIRRDRRRAARPCGLQPGAVGAEPELQPGAFRVGARATRATTCALDARGAARAAGDDARGCRSWTGAGRSTPMPTARASTTGRWRAARWGGRARAGCRCAARRSMPARCSGSLARARRHRDARGARWSAAVPEARTAGEAESAAAGGDPAGHAVVFHQPHRRGGGPGGERCRGARRRAAWPRRRRAMNAWLGSGLGGRSRDLVDHSGLAATSRIAAADMVRALVRPGARGAAAAASEADSRWARRRRPIVERQDRDAELRQGAGGIPRRRRRAGRWPSRSSPRTWSGVRHCRRPSASARPGRAPGRDGRASCSGGFCATGRWRTRERGRSGAPPRPPTRVAPDRPRPRRAAQGRGA